MTTINLNDEIEPAKDNTRRAKWVVILFLVVCAMELVSIVSDTMQINLLERAAIGFGVSDHELISNDDRQGWVAMFMVVAMVALTIGFLMWFSRTYHNLKRTGIKLAYRPSMAGWSFFIPIINFVRPYTIAMEIVEKTAVTLTAKQPEYTTMTKKGVVLGWWCAYILSSLVGYISAKLSIDAATVETLATATWFNIISSLVALVGAALGMVMVSNMARDEEELLRIRESE